MVGLCNPLLRYLRVSCSQRALWWGTKNNGKVSLSWVSSGDLPGWQWFGGGGGEGWCQEEVGLTEDQRLWEVVGGDDSVPSWGL